MHSGSYAPARTNTAPKEPKMLEKISSRLRRWLEHHHRTALRNAGVSYGIGLRLYGRPVVSVAPGSAIMIGDNVVLCSDSLHTALSLNHPIKLSTLNAGASITIGAHTGISGGAFIAAQQISIGTEVLIGANVTIIDTDFHPISATNRRHSNDSSKIGVAPIIIGDNVFIGASAIILKGTSIGSNSVVGAGSVVSGRFPENTILAGNPAKAIGQVFS